MGTKHSTTGGQHSFAQVPKAEIQRSSFNRSCGYKTTFSSGFLIPFFADEGLPADTFNVRATIFARLATPLKPIMDNIYVDTHYFAVPVRILWDNWVKLNGEQDNPGDSTDFLVPQISMGGLGVQLGTVEDYLGVPTDAPNLKISCLWHRAYNKIFNDWFRDENLTDSAIINKGDTDDAKSDYPLRRRSKRHDYFTSALPFAQKGPAVQLPLGQSAPVISTGTGVPTFNLGTESGVGLQYDSGVPVGAEVTNWNLQGATPGGNPLATWDQTRLTADLTEATASTINEIREAFQIQRLFERDARGGSRYIEALKVHFGVTSPDSRQQRSEYLGGGSQPLQMHQVAQTADMVSGGPGEETPQGNLAAYATAAGSASGFNKSFTEHVIIIGLISVRADLNYQQGLNRMFSRRTRFDFYWPALAHLGEQSLLNQEIFAVGPDADPATDLETWGFQERYAEYRYKPSLITGQMRSTAATSLDIWHLAQDFDELPVLGDEFIQENPPIPRILAVPSEPEFLLDAFFKIKCARPMPMYGVPGLIDHF